MSDDLVTWLNHTAGRLINGDIADCDVETAKLVQAAARIEAQEAEIARLKADLRTVQNAAKTISACQNTELEHLRQNKAFDHKLRAEHESLIERDAMMTDTLLAAESRASQAESALAKAVEVMRAVGHIGVDFGYGEYVLEDRFIQAARDFVKEHDLTTSDRGWCSGSRR